MTQGLPPNPSRFRSIDQWARQFYDYFVSDARVEEENDPLPVLLPHRGSGIAERAATEGVVLYDPVTQEAIISKDGAWCGIASLPAYTATQIADASHEVNTKNKCAGRMVYDSTNDTLAIANGAAATDTWSRLTMAATVTPS